MKIPLFHLTFRAKLYLKFSFGEACHQIYGQKFSFTVTCEQSRKMEFPTIYQTKYLPKWLFGIWLSLFLKHFYSFVSNWSIASRIKTYVNKGNAPLLMTSNYFRQHIAWYTLAHIWCYQIRCSDTKEWHIVIQSHSLKLIYIQLLMFMLLSNSTFKSKFHIWNLFAIIIMYLQ